MTEGEISREERNRGYAYRFNAAMAEAGWPQAEIEVIDGKMYRNVSTEVAPRAVVWQAFYLAKRGDPYPCWSCWSTAEATDPLGPEHEKGRWASDCATGRRGGCHFPDGPAFPPRELLRG